MKRKNRFMLGFCGTFFMLAVVSSKINTRACLVFTAVFWTVFVFLLRGKMLKDKPIIRDLAASCLIVLGYTPALYMIMGLGNDLAGLLRAIADDIAGLMSSFPLFEKAIYVVQRTVEELSQARDCIILVIRTGDVRQVKAFDWHYNYLILGISSGCLLLIRACCCILSALAALPGCLSEWLKSGNRTEAAA